MFGLIAPLLAASWLVQAASPTAEIGVPLGIVTRNGQRYQCKCYPGERCYPSPRLWKQLNSTVGGTLQLGLPPTSPCYRSVDGIPTYDAAKCADVRRNILDEQWKCVLEDTLIPTLS